MCVCVCVCVCVQNFNWLTWWLLLLIFTMDLLYITFSRYIMEQIVQRKLSLAEKAWIMLDRGIRTSIVSAVKM